MAGNFVPAFVGNKRRLDLFADVHAAVAALVERAAGGLVDGAGHVALQD